MVYRLIMPFPQHNYTLLSISCAVSVLTETVSITAAQCHRVCRSVCPFLGFSSLRQWTSHSKTMLPLDVYYHQQLALRPVV
jgi:hypothetical protein